MNERELNDSIEGLVLKWVELLGQYEESGSWTSGWFHDEGYPHPTPIPNVFIRAFGGEIPDVFLKAFEGDNEPD